MSGTSSYFVMTLPLMPELWQKEKLNKRFEVNRQIYNAILGEGLKRYRRMKERRDYRVLIQMLDSTVDVKERKRIYEKLDILEEEYRLRRFDFTKDATKYRRFFQKNTDAPVIQNLAVHAWKAVHSLVCRQAASVHPKAENELYSLEGKTNKTSIRYQDEKVIWKDLEIPVRTKGNAYEKQAFAQEIRYCRLKWKWIRGNKKYYVDLIFRGKCPVKPFLLAEDRKNLQREEARIEEKKKRVGMDIGLQKVVLVTDEAILDLKLPEKDQELEKARIYFARKLERSRRINHPDYYTEDGRIISGRKKWNDTINYRKNKLKYREILRKQTALRTEEQQKLIKLILTTGDIFFAEQLAFEKMRNRKEKQEKREKGKWNPVFGKTIENVAAAAFLRKLEWKIEQHGKQIVFVDPVKALAGSLNHVTGKREMLPYYKQCRNVNGYMVNKRAYSAFLLRHIEADSGVVNLEECKKAFPTFLILNEQTYGSQREHKVS